MVDEIKHPTVVLQGGVGREEALLQVDRQTGVLQEGFGIRSLGEELGNRKSSRWTKWWMDVLRNTAEVTT